MNTLKLDSKINKIRAASFTDNFPTFQNSLPSNQRNKHHPLKPKPHHISITLLPSSEYSPAREQLHLTRRLVDIAITAAYRTIEGCVVTGYRAVFPVGGYVVAGPKMRELDTHPADLHPEHALVQVGATVGAADRVLVARAAVLAFTARRTQAGCFVRGNTHACAKRCCVLFLF